jgi:hypothetical protein
MPRQSYNRRNEPKKRDETVKTKRGHALYNDSVTKACNQWLKSRSDPLHESLPVYNKPCVTVTNGKQRSAPFDPPSMQTMILADRVAYILSKKAKEHTAIPQSLPKAPQILPFEKQPPALGFGQKPAQSHPRRSKAPPPVRNLL